jgi:hypothetical protein
MSGPDSTRDDANPVDLGDDSITTPSPNLEVQVHLEPYLGPADEVVLAATDPLPDPNPVTAEFTHYNLTISIGQDGARMEVGVRENGARRNYFFLALIPAILLFAGLATYFIGRLASSADLLTVVLLVFGGCLLITLVSLAIVLVDKFAARR